MADSDSSTCTSSSSSSSASSAEQQVDPAVLHEEHLHPNGQYAIVNTSSCRMRTSTSILSHYRDWLGALQVLEISGDSRDDELLIDFLDPAKTHNSRLIVVGGDGTVSWVVNALDRLDWQSLADRPSICVIPVGMRNDLSRALGWGKSYSKTKFPALKKRHDRFEGDGEILLMDRWEVDITHYVGHQKFHLRKTMVSSFSIGCDAEISCTFQQLMKEHPRLTRGQLQRAFWYSSITLAHSPFGSLNLFLKVLIDGKDVPIPKGTRSVVVANINSFASGIKVWKVRKKDNSFKISEFDDGKLEVASFTGAVHLALGAFNLRSATLLGQGSVIDIYCGLEPHAVQLDGEILDFVSPIKVLVRHKGKVKTVVNKGVINKQEAPTMADAKEAAEDGHI